MKIYITPPYPSSFSALPNWICSSTPNVSKCCKARLCILSLDLEWKWKEWQMEMGTTLANQAKPKAIFLGKKTSRLKTSTNGGVIDMDDMKGTRFLLVGWLVGWVVCLVCSVCLVCFALLCFGLVWFWFNLVWFGCLVVCCCCCFYLLSASSTPWCLWFFPQIFITSPETGPQILPYPPGN